MFAADVLLCFTSILPCITGRRNKIEIRKEEETEIVARE
jgi:hypothetical protein